MVTYNPTIVNDNAYRQVLTLSGNVNLYYALPTVVNFTSVDNFFNVSVNSGTLLFSTYPEGCLTLLNPFLGAVSDLNLSTSGISVKSRLSLDTSTRIGPIDIGGSKRARRR